MGNTIAFKGTQVILDYDPRVGVCNWCRMVTADTVMHHEEYDYDNPIKHAIEICRRCHGIVHRKQELGAEMFLCLPDELIIQFRDKAYKKFGPKKGYLSKAGEEAFRLWLKDGT